MLAQHADTSTLPGDRTEDRIHSGLARYDSLFRRSSFREVSCTMCSQLSAHSPLNRRSCTLLNCAQHEYLSDIQVRRVYQSIVLGCPRDPEGSVQTGIGRDPRDRKRMTVYPVNSNRYFGSPPYMPAASHAGKDCRSYEPRHAALANAMASITLQAISGDAHTRPQGIFLIGRTVADVREGVGASSRPCSLFCLPDHGSPV